MSEPAQECQYPGCPTLTTRLLCPAHRCAECQHVLTPGTGHPDWPDTHPTCAVRAYMDYS